MTFSSVGSVTRPLSTVLDHVYLKPAIKAGSCTRRLGDTRETLLFIEEVNDFLWSQSIENKPTIFSLDVASFFPSVLQDLALPAITKVLENRNIKKAEAKAVSEGLKVVRDGNFFKWQNEFYNQISGCALGDPDSCSYTDISMASLLDEMIPSCESALSTSLDPLFKIYRDDGLGITLDPPDIIPSIKEFFNTFNSAIQWTIPHCNTCNTPWLSALTMSPLSSLTAGSNGSKFPRMTR